MFRILSASFTAVLLSVMFSMSLPAQENPEKVTTPTEDAASLEEASREAYENGKYARMYVANMKLHQMRPYTPEYMYNIVLSCALLGRRSTAYHFMLELQKQGLSYDFNQTDDSEAIRGSEAYDYINQLLVDAGQPAGEGTTAFTLPGDPTDFADITWDPSRDRFLVGTLTDGKVLAVSDDGKTEELIKAGPENGLWSISGLAVDPERNRLWISSSASTKFAGLSPAKKKHGALFEFTLDELEAVGSYSLPANMPDHELGKLTVTSDGHVYVLDRINPIVYRKSPEDRALKAFVTSNDLVELTDIVVSPDHSRLYVSDAVMGIFVVDPAEFQTTMLRGPENLNLSGINSIEYDQGRLVIFQGGLSPERLLRLKLDADGTLVEEFTPMAIALEQFDSPGAGTIRADNVYYFANNGSSESKAGAIVMSTPIEAGQDIVSPDMKQFQEALMQSQQQKQQQ